MLSLLQLVIMFQPGWICLHETPVTICIASVCNGWLHLLRCCPAVFTGNHSSVRTLEVTSARRKTKVSFPPLRVITTIDCSQVVFSLAFIIQYWQLKFMLSTFDGLHVYKQIPEYYISLYLHFGEEIVRQLYCPVPCAIENS